MLEFNLYDEIEDYNVNEAIKFLNDNLEEDVTLNIDSIGGDVFAGLRLCQAIQNHKGKVTAKCGIVVASIASVIALSCDELVLTKDTFFMVHQAWAVAQGTAEELMSTASLLEQASNRIQEIVAEKAKDVEAVAEWFKGDTWMGYQAVLDNFNAVTLVDEVKTLTAKAVASISKLNNKPEALVELVAKAQAEEEEKKEEPPKDEEDEPQEDEDKKEDTEEEEKKAQAKAYVDSVMAKANLILNG